MYKLCSKNIPLFFALLIATTLTSSTKVYSQTYNAASLQLFQHKNEILVRDITRDTKGFIWYIANAKVYRFDGDRSVEVLTTLAENNQAYKDIPQRILADSRDRLWIAGNETLSYLDLKNWKLHPIKLKELSAIAVKDVEWIKEAPNGSVLVGFSTGHVLWHHHDQVIINSTLYDKRLQTNSNVRVRSCSFWKGKAWIGTSTGELLSILLNDPDESKLHSFSGVTKSIDFVLPQNESLLLGIFETGIFKFDPVRESQLEKKKNAEKNTSKYLAASGEYFNVYVANGKLSLLAKDQLRLFTEIDLGSRKLEDIFDVEVFGKEIVLATSKGIWVYYENEQALSHIIPSYTNRSTRGIYKFEDGSIFYCSYGGAAFISTTGETTKFPNLTEGYALLPLPNEQLLIGIEGGGLLKIFDKKEKSLNDFEYSIPQKVRRKNKYNLPQYIISLAQDDHQYYLGTKKGLWLLSKTSREATPFEDSKGNKPTLNMKIHQINVLDDDLLLSTHLGLMRCTHHQVEKLYPKTSSIGISQHVMERDTIWLATQSRGVIGIDQEGKVLKTLNQASGLADDMVYSLTIQNGYKIAGTSNGLSIIKEGKIKNLTTRLGLLNNEFNTGASFYDVKNKHLYLGGIKGYSMIDLHYDWTKNEKLNPLYISEINYIDTREERMIKDYTFPYRDFSTIHLPSNQNFIEIKIGEPFNYKTATSLTYKIEEVTKGWKSISTANLITFVGIEPQAYQLFLTSTGKFPSVSPIHLKIIKAPAFYQTWWFRVGLLLLTAFLVWVFFKQRIKKIRKEERLRTQISSDLHDEVGSLLTGISMQTDFLQMSKKKINNDNYLQSISNSSKEAIQAMGDIVWSIDARNDNWKSMIARLREYAYQLFDAAGIDFVLEEHGSPPTKFSQKDRGALYLIIKEALNNSCKHAKATQAKIVIEYLPKEIVIEIRDNGLGFNAAKETTGHGLKNMKSRAESIKASLKITSSSTGTQVFLHKKV